MTLRRRAPSATPASASRCVLASSGPRWTISAFIASTGAAAVGRRDGRSQLVGLPGVRPRRGPARRGGGGARAARLLHGRPRLGGGAESPACLRRRADRDVEAVARRLPQVRRGGGDALL